MLIQRDYSFWKNFTLLFFFLYPIYWLIHLLVFFYSLIFKYFILLMFCFSSFLNNLTNFDKFNHFIIFLKLHYNNHFKFFDVIAIISALGLFDFLISYIKIFIINLWYFVYEALLQILYIHLARIVIFFYTKYKDVILYLNFSLITPAQIYIKPVSRNFMFNLVYFFKNWFFKILNLIIFFIPLHSWRTFFPKFLNYSYLYLALFSINLFYWCFYFVFILFFYIIFLFFYFLNLFFYVFLNSFLFLYYIIQLYFYYLFVCFYNVSVVLPRLLLKYFKK